MAKKKITINDLAVMVQRGFEATEKRFEQVDKKFEHLETNMNERFDKVDDRLDNLERVVSDIKTKFIRLEYEDLPERVAYIERKLGIKNRK